MTQDEALERLRHGTIVEKRGAAMRLATIGDAAATPALVETLASEDVVLVSLAERALWEIWCRSGIPEVDAVLREGVAAMERGKYDSAVALFTTVIQMAPDFPEGYNKRATAHYLAGRTRLAIADCEVTLRRNPLHFGAASGQGLCHAALGEFDKAASCFRRALEIHPRLGSARQNLAGALRVRVAGGNGHGQDG
jgi:tetratricopeptide (TPR) repeat protein